MSVLLFWVGEETPQKLGTTLYFFFSLSFPLTMQSKFQIKSDEGERERERERREREKERERGERGREGEREREENGMDDDGEIGLFFSFFLFSWKNLLHQTKVLIADPFRSTLHSQLLMPDQQHTLNKLPTDLRSRNFC